MKQFYYAVYLLIFYSLCDYIGYNKSKKDGAVNIYHGMMVGMLVWYAGCVWWWVSLRCAIILLVLWWTWLADWMYYGWAMLTNGFGNIAWDGRRITGAIFKVNAITSAEWTPVGLANKYFFGQKVSQWQELIGMTLCGIGASICVAIN